MRTLFGTSFSNRWLLCGALSVALLGLLPGKISAQSSAASEPDAGHYVLRVPGEIVGGTLGGAVGLGLGVGITLLALAPFEEPPTRYNEYDELESGCEWGCHTGERVLITLLGAVLTIGTTAFGIALGTLGGGELFGGHGNLGATLIGLSFGLAAQLAVTLAVAAADPGEDTKVTMLIASCALPIVGAVIGYEVRHARWKPQVSVTPDGTGAYVGATVSF